MPTTIKISGVMAPTGRLLRGRVYAPDGTTAGDVALAESPAGSGQYGGSDGLTLADTAADPYEQEVREVATQDIAGFDASTTVRRSRGFLGYVAGGVLCDTRTVNPATIYSVTVV
jgi:hypothetical protein